MKKTLFLLLCCLLILSGVWGFEIEDRRFEVGLNAGFGFSNDFLSLSEVFRETVILDLDELAKGFNLNLWLGASPLYFNYNHNNLWGFGLSTGIYSTGVIDLSGKLLSFDEAVNAKSEINASVFAEIGTPVFFHIDKFKIKVKPSLYYPILYMKSDISYTFDRTNAGTIFNIGFDINVYTIFPTESDNFDITSAPGFDISIGAEYPLSEALGIKQKIPLLDFDAGIDLVNIPIVPSKMRNYMRLTGRIGSDKPFTFFSDDDDMDMDSIFSIDDDTEYGTKDQRVFRPFKTLIWADWRPLGTQLFTVRPTIGFSINPLFIKPFSLEAGLKASLDINNFFMASAGIGYHDRFWRNSIDLALNLRAFEINLGADMRSSNFLKSWAGNGFGLYIGLKFGW